MAFSELQAEQRIKSAFYKVVSIQKVDLVLPFAILSDSGQNKADCDGEERSSNQKEQDERRKAFAAIFGSA